MFRIISSAVLCVVSVCYELWIFLLNIYDILVIMCDIGNEVLPWEVIPKPHFMLMTSANFTQKLSAFLISAI